MSFISLTKGSPTPYFLQPPTQLTFPIFVSVAVDSIVFDDKETPMLPYPIVDRITYLLDVKGSGYRTVYSLVFTNYPPNYYLCDDFVRL
jgi:hypothetical protein